MLIDLVITDFFKLKKNFIWKLVFFIPILCACLLQLLIVAQYKSLNDFCNSNEINGWFLLIGQNSGPVFWPSIINLIIMITSISVYQVEFKNNAINTQMCLPVNKSKIFISKILVILIFTFISILLNFIGLILIGLFNGIIDPFPYEKYFKYLIFQFCSVIGTIILSNWIASLFKNILIPYIVGILGFGIGTVLPHELKALSYFFPYSYPIYAVDMSGFSGSVAVLGGVISGAIILFFSIYEYINRDIK